MNHAGYWAEKVVHRYFPAKDHFSNLISNAIKYQDFAKEQNKLDIQINANVTHYTIQFTDKWH